MKIGYCYVLFLSDYMKNDFRSNYELGVYILFNNNSYTEDILNEMSKYIKVFYNIEEEKIDFNITPNPYYKEVKIVDYTFDQDAFYVVPTLISLEEGNEIVKQYCQQIKNGEIDKNHIDLYGETSSYWLSEKY